MGLYFTFYVERRSPDGWIVPEGFEHKPSYPGEPCLGRFTCVRASWGWTDLFRGDAALFPMRVGRPPDRRGSPLFQYLDTFFDYERDEQALSWIPYEELLVDCWEAETVLLRSKVPARYALLFGDGQGTFPRAELLAAGMAARDWPGPRETRPAREPADMTFGPHRFHVSELPPEREVEVTWRETVSGLMGEEYADDFRRLRRYGPDEDLRVLAWLG